MATEKKRTKAKMRGGAGARTMSPRVRRASEGASRGDARAFTVVLEDIYAKIGGMAELLQLHSEKFDAMDARFDAMDARFDAMDARFDAMDARFDAMDARFDAMDARFDRLHGDVELLKLATIENTRGIARLETKTDEHTEAIHRLEAGLAGKADRFGS